MEAETYMHIKTKGISAYFLFILLVSWFIIYSCQGLGESYAITSFGSVKPNIMTYFQSKFSKEGPDGYKTNQSWVREEPCGYPNELGVWHWVNCGPNWGTLRLVPDPADANRTCLEMLLDTLGDRPLPSNQHVKLYECQSREAENYMEPYPTLKEAYWQMKYWFPSDFKVEPYSWRLIWQFCGEEGYYGSGEYIHPQMALVFGGTYLYLQNSGAYRPNGESVSYPLVKNVDLPKERWVSIQVYVKQGSAFKSLDGHVIVWIDGVKVFERYDVSTATQTGTPYVIWSIGNYGGPYEAQGQFIYIKDVKVTSEYKES